MVQLRIGGVPEHFNLPVHLARESGQFKANGIELSWTNFPGGTGQMTRALREGEVDACILLTEGIIKDILAGSPARIISGYVNTPLTWGIHTGVNNTLQHHSEIYDRKYAISRLGSGSHLMAIVDSNLHERELKPEQFHIIKNLDGALPSLDRLETDVFYWEKYTTKPWVDRGELRRVSEFVTPWPCFMIAATEDILEREPHAVVQMLQTIHFACERFMERETNISLVAKRYSQKLSDVARWYHATEWATHGWVSDKMLRGVVHNLKVAEIVGRDVDAELVWRR